jgi:hypothetical protein
MARKGVESGPRSELLRGRNRAVKITSLVQTLLVLDGRSPSHATAWFPWARGSAALTWVRCMKLRRLNRADHP